MRGCAVPAGCGGSCGWEDGLMMTCMYGDSLVSGGGDRIWPVRQLGEGNPASLSQGVKQVSTAGSGAGQVSAGLGGAEWLSEAGEYR